MGSGLKIRFKQVLQHVVTPKNYWSQLYLTGRTGSSRVNSIPKILIVNDQKLISLTKCHANFISISDELAGYPAAELNQI